MLDLVESVFLRNGIQNLRYDGSMNREAREYTLSRFRQNGGPKVILIRFVWLFCFVRSARFAALICDICIQHEVWWRRSEPYFSQSHR